MEIQQFPLWDRLSGHRVPLGFDIELTSRCNIESRHCYISLPSDDAVAKVSELKGDEILGIGRQTIELGAVWCMATGGANRCCVLILRRFTSASSGTIS